MDMVNDGKVIRLDTPQAVKEALSGALRQRRHRCTRRQG